MSAALAIIIPHLNDIVRLRRCLAALDAQIGEDVEVVVADNGSAIRLDGITRDFAWVQVVCAPVLGAGLARNAGVAGTTAPVLAFLDCDCVPASDWIARLRNCQPGWQVIGGRVETFDEAGGPLTSAQLFERVFAFDNARYVRELGFSVTANLVTSRALFETAGPFRAGIPEDMEWCARARAAGAAVVYDETLLVRHPTREDWPALCRKYRRIVEERFALRQDGPGEWAIRAVLTGLSPLRDTVKVIRSPRLRGTRERLRCLGALYRLRLARMGWMLRALRIGRGKTSQRIWDQSF